MKKTCLSALSLSLILTSTSLVPAYGGLEDDSSDSIQRSALLLKKQEKMQGLFRDVSLPGVRYWAHQSPENRQDLFLGAPFEIQELLWNYAEPKDDGYDDIRWVITHEKQEEMERLISITYDMALAYWENQLPRERDDLKKYVRIPIELDHKIWLYGKPKGGTDGMRASILPKKQEKMQGLFRDENRQALTFWNEHSPRDRQDLFLGAPSEIQELLWNYAKPKDENDIQVWKGICDHLMEELDWNPERNFSICLTSSHPQYERNPEFWDKKMVFFRLALRGYSSDAWKCPPHSWEKSYSRRAWGPLGDLAGLLIEAVSHLGQSADRIKLYETIYKCDSKELLEGKPFLMGIYPQMYLGAEGHFTRLFVRGQPMGANYDSPSEYWSAILCNPKSLEPAQELFKHFNETWARRALYQTFQSFPENLRSKKELWDPRTPGSYGERLQKLPRGLGGAVFSDKWVSPSHVFGIEGFSFFLREYFPSSAVTDLEMRYAWRLFSEMFPSPYPLFELTEGRIHTLSQATSWIQMEKVKTFEEMLSSLEKKKPNRPSIDEDIFKSLQGDKSEDDLAVIRELLYKPIEKERETDKAFLSHRPTYLLTLWQTLSLKECTLDHLREMDQWLQKWPDEPGGAMGTWILATRMRFWKNFEDLRRAFEEISPDWEETYDDSWSNHVPSCLSFLCEHLPHHQLIDPQAE